MIARRGRRGLLLFPAYHNVVDDLHDAGADVSLTFAVAQIGALSETHRIVPLDAVERGRRPMRA